MSRPQAIRTVLLLLAVLLLCCWSTLEAQRFPVPVQVTAKCGYTPTQAAVLVQSALATAVTAYDAQAPQNFPRRLYCVQTLAR